MMKGVREVYLDNNATTRTDPAVVAAMLPFFTSEFHNPSSSSYLGGLHARGAVEQARARVAALARGAVVMTASDRDISVTLSFRGREVVVTDGTASGAPVIAGPWLEMAKLCSGQLSPVKAVAQKQLVITPSAHGLTALAGAGYALSIPPSFYGDEEAVAKRRRQTQITIAVGGGVGVLIAGRRHRRHAGM